jgi:hypothetical protein
MRDKLHIAKNTAKTLNFEHAYKQPGTRNFQLQTQLRILLVLLCKLHYNRSCPETGLPDSCNLQGVLLTANIY